MYRSAIAVSLMMMVKKYWRSVFVANTCACELRQLRSNLSDEIIYYYCFEISGEKFRDFK